MKTRPAEPHWPEVLTDWCVVQALGKAGWPERLGGTGELQAAFVSEVSGYLKFRGLYLRELAAENLVRTTIETVYARSGGSAYCAAKETAEAAQSEFLSALGRSQRDPAGVLQIAGVPQRLQDRLRTCEYYLDACRRPLVPAARVAAREAAEAYWNAVAACRFARGIFRPRS